MKLITKFFHSGLKFAIKPDPRYINKQAIASAVESGLRDFPGTRRIWFGGNNRKFKQNGSESRQSSLTNEERKALTELGLTSLLSPLPYPAAVPASLKVAVTNINYEERFCLLETMMKMKLVLN